MIVELIGSSSSFPKGMTMSSTGGSSCSTVSAAGASATGVSEEGTTVAGISASSKTSFSSESGLEREKNNIVHVNNK